MAPMKYTRLGLGHLYSDSSEEEKEEQNLSNGPKHDKQQSTKQSDDDDDEEEEEEEEEEEISEEEEEEEISEEEDEEETPPVTPEKKISAPKPISTVAPSQPQSSSATGADEESDSETDSGYDRVTLRSPADSDFTVKPVLSKPAGNSGNVSRAKKVASTPAVKRPAENQSRGDSKGKKARVSNGDEEDVPMEEKKFAINRLWSEEDEIALLQGMIDYQLKKGVDAYTDLADFHEFIKGLVHVDVTKNQLTDKIRRLKKKYQNNADKGENGEDPVFSRPHEYKSFALSKKIWGSGNSNGVDNGVKINNAKSRKSGKVDNFVRQEQPFKDEIVMVDQKDFWSMYPQLNESLNLEKSIYLSCGRNFLKENMRLIGSKKASELNKKWKDLFVGELELYSKRLELIEEQTKLVLDAIKSSKS